MQYVIIGLIILFWLDYRHFKKQSIKVLEDLENRIKEMEFPQEWRKMKKMWGTSEEKITKEIKEMMPNSK